MTLAASASSEKSCTSSRSVPPAEAIASRAVMEPFVSTSRTNRSRSVICSTRVFSTEYETLRTGEKIESTGITPIGSRGFLFLSAMR